MIGFDLKVKLTDDQKLKAPSTGWQTAQCYYTVNPVKVRNLLVSTILVVSYSCLYSGGAEEERANWAADEEKGWGSDAIGRGWGWARVQVSKVSLKNYPLLLFFIPTHRWDQAGPAGEYGGGSGFGGQDDMMRDLILLGMLPTTSESQVGEPKLLC